MKTATAKELRNRAASILDRVRRGGEVVITMRGKSVAVIKPVEDREKPFKPVGFGMWRDRAEMKNVGAWLADRRKERHQR